MEDWENKVWTRKEIKKITSAIQREIVWLRNEAADPDNTPCRTERFKKAHDTLYQLQYGVHVALMKFNR